MDEEWEDYLNGQPITGFEECLDELDALDEESDMRFCDYSGYCNRHLCPRCRECGRYD